MFKRKEKGSRHSSSAASFKPTPRSFSNPRNLETNSNKVSNLSKRWKPYSSSKICCAGGEEGEYANKSESNGCSLVIPF